MQTKEKILTVSRGLFNRYGYRNVTMRRIAEEAGISPGNLTYYFPHKTDIVTALMDRSFGETYFETPIATLEDLLEQFRRMLVTIETNAFFFLDDELDCKPNAHNATLRRRLAGGMTTLTETCVFRADFSREERETVLQMLLMTHMTWVRLTLRDGQSLSVDDMIGMHRTILAPYLTGQ
ncbi:MAG: helix-turn-helix domain-containing protein [Clostridia bacterium]|nr:helix-turn-helix domain-containing protein [Clostridia bacterium]